MRLKIRVATVTSLLLVMITCLGSYAAAGTGWSADSDSSVLLAGLYESPVLALAGPGGRLLEDLVRPEQPSLEQAVPGPEDQFSCQESCTIRQAGNFKE